MAKHNHDIRPDQVRKLAKAWQDHVDAVWFPDCPEAVDQAFERVKAVYEAVCRNSTQAEITAALNQAPRGRS